MEKKHMFSSGAEYDAFLKRNCFECPFYVHYEDANEHNPECEIEERIAIGGASVFPYDWLDENSSMARFDCRKRLGLNKK